MKNYLRRSLFESLWKVLHGKPNLIQVVTGPRQVGKTTFPKLLVMENALISAMASQNFGEVKKNKILWGRMLENTIGAKLYAILQKKGASLFYWRQRQEEIDYVIQAGDRLIAVEVKSGIAKQAETYLIAFRRQYKKAKPVIISPLKDLRDKKKDIKYITIEQFFNEPDKSIGL